MGLINLGNVRDNLGINGGIDTYSSTYQGGKFAGAVNVTAIGIVAGVNGAAGLASALRNGGGAGLALAGGGSTGTGASAILATATGAAEVAVGVYATTQGVQTAAAVGGLGLLNVASTVNDGSGSNSPGGSNGPAGCASNTPTTTYNSIGEALGDRAKGFTSRKGGLTKNKVDNTELLNKLRDIEPGKWQKVYKDGLIDGKKVSLHFFESPSGKVFDPAIKPGWSN